MVLSGNLLTSVPAGFFQDNPAITEVDLASNNITVLGRSWLGEAQKLSKLNMRVSSNPSSCTLSRDINDLLSVSCRCAPGLAGDAQGFCVRSCSSTIVDTARRLEFNVSECLGFELPRDLLAGSRPCVRNATTSM